MLDKDAIKNAISSDDVIAIIRSLGGRDPIITNKALIFETLCHNRPGEGSMKLFYYNESKIFHCYTECADSFDIYALIIKNHKVKGIDLTFPESVQYVASISGQYIETDYSIDYIDDWSFINRILKEDASPDKLPIFSKNNLQMLIPAPNIWLHEGITPEVAEKFGVGFYLAANRIAIPHFDKDGNLIGIRGRATNEDEIAAGYKYMPLKIGDDLLSYPMMYSLYGLNHNLQTIKKVQKVVLFEAEKSVMKSEVFYPGNNFTLALCSSNISDYQRDLLLELEIDEVMLALDKEFDSLSSIEAKKYEQKILKLAAKFTPYMRTYAIWDKKGLLQKKDAPIDRGKDVLEELMKDKIEVTTQMTKGVVL